MKEHKDKNLSDRELQLYHEFFADSIIDPNMYSHKAHYLDRNDSDITKSIIEKEESKFRSSLRNVGNIPTEVWMG